MQVAANTKGIQLVRELIAEHSLGVVQAYMGFIQANAGAAMWRGAHSSDWGWGCMKEWQTSPDKRHP
jgi:N-methylhydantoinase B/oxoprolinase/acetone carboxylase alpha subunit